MNEVREVPWLDEGRFAALQDVGALLGSSESVGRGEACLRLEVLLRAAAAGNWTACRRSIEREAAARVEAGRALVEAFEESRAATRSLLPLLVEAYGDDRSRFTGACQALFDFADRAAAVLIQAFAARREAKGRAEDADLATTFNSIGDAVIVTDASGRIARMNPIAERLTGFELAECLGRPLEEVFRIQSEETHQPVESPVPRVLREGTIVGLANHTELVRRDGTRCPIADSGAPVRRESGEIVGVVLVFRDVTDERRTELALRHWERIFQYATWGVATASIKEVRFEAVNPAYAAMHGYTVDELVGAPVSKLWAPETRADMERHAAETHDHGRLVAETTHLRKDGTRLPVEVVATTIKNAQGEVEWFVANVQDISERKLLQQSRLRAVELEAENRRIEEANRLKSEFLANMSHELRTPLNAIIGFAQLLEDGQVGELEPIQKEFMGDILAGGVHLLRLINDVLDLAKVEAGKMEFRPERVDLAALANGVIQNLRTLAMKKSVQVELAPLPPLLDITIDPSRFTQILYNYLSNAIKFSPEGAAVLVRLAGNGPLEFRVEVEDEGPGVPAEQASRLFTPFQQLDSSTTRKHGGTGLGLALTKRLAEAQGGSVGMRAAPRRGTVFFAVLPRKTAAPPDTERGPDAQQVTTVLVVEGNPSHRLILTRMLREAGYAVEEARTLAEATAAWSRKPYDAIVLNFLLTEGQELQAFLSLVKAGRKHSRVPLIALTVVSEDGGVTACAVNDVLAKPVEAGALLELLEREGAPPTQGRPVFVVDDDAASLKLMSTLLSKLGYESLCFSNAAEALEALTHAHPLGVILDLLMPTMDGFAFLEEFRRTLENSQIPVLVWTVKDLSGDERRRLERATQAILPKGSGEQHSLFAALRSFLTPTVTSGAVKR